MLILNTLTIIVQIAAVGIVSILSMNIIRQFTSAARRMAVLAPAVFLNHGGGPLPLMGEKESAGLTKFLREDLKQHINLKDIKAIILVTAHWEESKVTISSAKHHDLYFDYYGFPPETYKYKYDAPGNPEIAKRIQNALKKEGIDSKLDDQRGWDHGVFVPMMLVNPSADIPIIQVSVLSNQDPEQHYNLGQVLQQFRKESIAVFGSGMSYHNMREFMGRRSREVVNEPFDEYLNKVCTAEDEAVRRQGLIAWRQQVGASEAHPPRAAEHFMPLIVIAGAGGSKAGERIFNWDYSGQFRLNIPAQATISGCYAIQTGVYRAGKDFCLQTSMHGFNHIAAPRRHWLERLLWVCVTACAIWGAVNISRDQWTRFNENPTVVTLEKDFRSWVFPLPGVTECDVNRADPAKLPAAILSRWNATPGDERYSYLSEFVNTVANSDLLHLGQFQQYVGDSSLQVDLYQLAVDVMPDVAGNIKVIWTGTEQPTAEWTPVMTEAGACYAINSLAVADIAIEKPDENETMKYPMHCKNSAPGCYVIMELTRTVNFSLHSPYDVSDITAEPYRVYLTLNRQCVLSVTETRCGEGVRGLSVRRRGCLYVDEAANKQVYSTNMCRRSCRNDFAVEKCGCKPFYNKYEEGRACSVAGMACISAWARELDTMKCACMLQCVDAVYKETANEFTIWDSGLFAGRGSIRFTVDPPQTRYTREIVFHFHDLVVSFGGAAGLFLGASFLSFVEIGYFLLETVIRTCVPAAQRTLTAKQDSKRMVPYEQARILELNSVLDGQRKFDRTNPRVYATY